LVEYGNVKHSTKKSRNKREERKKMTEEERGPGGVCYSCKQNPDIPPLYGGLKKIFYIGKGKEEK